jgi:hypothetical protein
MIFPRRFHSTCTTRPVTLNNTLWQEVKIIVDLPMLAYVTSHLRLDRNSHTDFPLLLKLKERIFSLTCA